MVSIPQQPPLHNPGLHWFLQHPISVLTLSLAITVIVIAGLIHPLMSGLNDAHTPRGKLDFTENEAGLYGCFYQLTENVSFEYIRFTIEDESEGATASLEPLASREVLQIPGGFNATFYDYNENDRIDGYDLLRAHNYAKGDTFTFTYLPTGGIITKYSLIS